MKNLKHMIEEETGHKCWMDIGEMGGGDVMNEKLADGIRAAKVSCELKIACTIKTRNTDSCSQQGSLELHTVRTL